MFDGFDFELADIIVLKTLSSGHNPGSGFCLILRIFDPYFVLGGQYFSRATFCFMKTVNDSTIQCPYHSPFPRWRQPAVSSKGIFHRACDGAKIRRFRCFECKRTFSEATTTHEFRQRKRSINETLFSLLASNKSMRRSALMTRVARKTVDRRLVYFAKVSTDYQKRLLNNLSPVTKIHFDDMETSEHTKMKPISIPLVVEHPSRLVLAFDIASMPAKGLLAKRSQKKYGKRKDERPHAWRNVLTKAAEISVSDVSITSDSHKCYPQLIRKFVPGANHTQVKGRRGCVAGQGELKVGGWDPLFSLNHTAAMFRANICRLIRRTWCTTKIPERLKHHIGLYVMWHNETILAKLENRPRAFPFP